jgi:hypothetical protein
MRYTRYYAEEIGTSHTEDVEVGLSPQLFAPPAPPLDLSPFAEAAAFAFVRCPTGWVGDWHPTPRRQFFLFLSGELEAETSDGVRRRYGPGSVVLLEDTTGVGHRSRVIGDQDVIAAIVQLPAAV